MLAAYNGNLEFLALLIEGTPDRSPPGPEGPDPTKGGHFVEAATEDDLFVRNRYKSTALHYAAMRGEGEACGMLLQACPGLVRGIFGFGERGCFLGRQDIFGEGGIVFLFL